MSGKGGAAMTRRVILSLLLLCVAMPALLAEEKKEKKKQKPSYVGVMLSAGKDKGTFLVMSVFPDTPAAKAGLKPGDLILEIDGAKPQDLQTAVKFIASLKAGRKAKFVIRRDGKEGAIDVVPAERDE
jgi:S1-C subfamily serine protease